MGDIQSISRLFRRRGWQFTGLDRSEIRPGSIVRRQLRGVNRRAFESLSHLRDMDSDEDEHNPGPRVSIHDQFARVTRFSAGRCTNPIHGRVELDFKRASSIVFMHGESVLIQHAVELGRPGAGTKLSLFRNLAARNPGWDHVRNIVVLKAWRVKDARFISTSSASRRVVLTGSDATFRMGSALDLKLDDARNLSYEIPGWHTVAFQGARVSSGGRILPIL